MSLYRRQLSAVGSRVRALTLLRRGTERHWRRVKSQQLQLQTTTRVIVNETAAATLQARTL